MLSAIKPMIAAIPPDNDVNRHARRLTDDEISESERVALALAAQIKWKMVA